MSSVPIVISENPSEEELERTRLMDAEDDGKDFVVRLKNSAVGMSWEERSKMNREVLNLVKSQRIRDFDRLPPQMYAFLLDSIRLEWERPQDLAQNEAQSAFAGLIGFPEFETQVAGKFVNDGFLLDLCGRFQAGFSEERGFLRDTLHWAYASFPQKRPLLRQQIGAVLAQFLRSPSRQYHVAELLQVLRQIIKGFPQTYSQVHKSLLTGVLLPLHTPNQMAVWSSQQPLIETYHEALVGCLIPFIEQEPELTHIILEAVVAAWPEGFNSNTAKEVLLLHELETLIKFVPPAACEAALSVLLPKVVGCLALENSRVVERALFLFKDDLFLDMVAKFSQKTFLPVVSALLRDGEPFWNPTVTKMTAYVLESLEGRNCVAFAAACEALWGHPRSAPNKEEPPQLGSQGGVNVSLAGSADKMGSERPLFARHTVRSSCSKSARRTPVAVTGVAPWAFSGSAPLPRPHATERSKSARTGIKSSTPPVPSLKRVRSRAAGGPEDDSEKRSSAVVCNLSSTSDHSCTTSSAGQGLSTPPKSGGDRQLSEESRNHVIQTGETGQAETHFLTPSCQRDGSGEAFDGEGPGLRKVRKFIARIKPSAEGQESGVSWQDLQLQPTPTLLPHLRFHDLVFGHELGEGSFSVVRYARQIVKGKSRSQWPEFAVKVVSTTKVKELNYDKSVTNEIASLRVLSHPGIARLISAFRWRDGAYLVLEYASRGDLHGHIKQHGSLSEASTRFVVGEVVAALCSVHDFGFVFGDLKPENVVITESGHIKLTDFGACRPTTAAAQRVLDKSRHALRTLRDGDWRGAAGQPSSPQYGTIGGGDDSDSESDGISDSGVEGRLANSSGNATGGANGDGQVRAEGTAAYMPPEVARGGAPGFGADAWALGCVTFLCLAGRPPIFAESDAAIMAKVVRFAVPGADGTRVGGEDLPNLPHSASAALRSFVGALMEPDPSIRLGVERATRHEFLVHDGMDVFSLHRKKPFELAQGTIAPTPNAAWSRRQHSMIWAPMPHEYRFEASALDLKVIEEQDVERGAGFRRQLRAFRELDEAA